jgi:hypothetical protein
MILIADPAYNEPNVEQMRGTAEGKQRSSVYNFEVRSCRGLAVEKNQGLCCGQIKAEQRKQCEPCRGADPALAPFCRADPPISNPVLAPSCSACDTEMCVRCKRVVGGLNGVMTGKCCLVQLFSQSLPVSNENIVGCFQFAPRDRGEGFKASGRDSEH